MASNINDLLQQDDAIESLSDAEVRDVWARSTLAKWLFRNRVWHDDERLFTELLGDGDDAAIYSVVRTVSPRLADKWGLRPDTEDSFNAEQLFDMFTVDADELPDDVTLHDVARGKLKSTLRGSGMPRMKVARQRVGYHTDDD